MSKQPLFKKLLHCIYNDLLKQRLSKAACGQLDSAIYELRKTIILDKLNPEGFNNLVALITKTSNDKANLLGTMFEIKT